MKIKVIVSVLFGALFIVLGCVNITLAQTDQITGGYGEADVKDAEVVKAARFAVKKRGQTQQASITLLSIKKAQMQVVAGLNYELCLRVKVKKSGKKSVNQFVKTVVYRDLKNRYSLTSWMVKKRTDCQ